MVDIWEAKTDAEGGYRIAGVRGIKGSEYQHFAMDVNAPGFVEFIEFYFAGFDQIANSKGHVSEVRLERGDAVTGRCIGPDGKSEPGAKLHAAFAGKPMSSLGRTRATDAEGRFRLTIPHGLATELIIYPELGDRQPNHLTRSRVPRRVSIAAGGGDLGDIRLEEGVESNGGLIISPMLLSLEKASYLSANRVPGGWTPAGLVIALESVDRGAFGSFPITLACKTDRSGRFRAPPLEGSYKIWVAQAHDSARTIADRSFRKARFFRSCPRS